MRVVDQGRVEKAARWLVRQHVERRPSRPMPSSVAPRDIDEAYAVQQAFVCLKAQACGAPAGYKVALTNPKMQALVGLRDPIGGRLHARQVVRGPASVRAADYGRLLVEFEVAVQLAADLPARPTPYSPQEMAAAVDAVMPAFELADDRGADYATLAARGLELAADNAWNEGAVLGAPLRRFQDIDLAAVRGTAFINGEAVGEGLGAECMGHPLAALAWVANHAARLGPGLLAGDFVICGSLVTSKFPRAGDRVRFDAGALGTVELSVT